MIDPNAGIGTDPAHGLGKYGDRSRGNLPGAFERYGSVRLNNQAQGLGSSGFNPFAYGGRGRQYGGNQWGNMQGGIGGLLRAMQFRPPQNMAALRNQNFTGGS
jgi:hypothetical protein